MAKRRRDNDSNDEYSLSLRGKTPDKFKPRTRCQSRYLDAIRRNDMTIGIGPAGTGKTFVAAVYAIEQLSERKIEKIVLTRPTVSERGEEIGFLPGSADRKLGPWLAPIVDAFEERAGKDKVKTWMRDGLIEIAPLTFMRGRTFKNAVVLADEAQNMTPSQAKKLVTRAGDSAKYIVSGDLEQADIPAPTGLHQLVDMAEQLHLPVPVVEFDAEDCVRSPLCQMWVRAFARWEGD